MFEDNDIQLTNEAVVTESYLLLALSRDDRPDETYLVASCMEPWCVFPILVDEKSYFDLSDADQAYWQVDQNKLADELRNKAT